MALGLFSCPIKKKVMFNTCAYGDKTVMVTGASGFIGACLSDVLAQGGARVIGVSRRRRSSDSENMSWVQADLSDYESVENCIQSTSPQIIFHLASEVTGSRDLPQVIPTLQSNLVSTVNLLRAATEAGCSRIVLAGSLEEPAPGDPDPTPCSPYAAAKWAASGYARMFHALYQTPVVTARIFMVYGPGQNDTRKLVPYVCLATCRGERPRLSSGQRPVDWVYVDDVVEGLLRMGVHAGIQGKTIDLGSGELATVERVATAITAFASHPLEPLFGALPDRAMEQIRAADVEATRQALDWSPKTPLREGLHKTFLWYCNAASSERHDTVCR